MSLKIRIKDPSIKKNVENNEGYCPCMVFKTPDTKCMCKEFRDQDKPGPCICGLYEKYESNITPIINESTGFIFNN